MLSHRTFQDMLDQLDCSKITSIRRFEGVVRSQYKLRGYGLSSLNSYSKVKTCLVVSRVSRLRDPSFIPIVGNATCGVLRRARYDINAFCTLLSTLTPAYSQR